MVDAVEMPSPFHRGNVGGFFDNADQFLVTGWAAAVDARIDVGDVVADRAKTQTGFDVANGSGQRIGVVIAGSQNVECKALSALAADTWQLLEFIDEPGHGLSKFGH